MTAPTDDAHHDCLQLDEEHQDTLRDILLHYTNNVNGEKLAFDAQVKLNRIVVFSKDILERLAKMKE